MQARRPFFHLRHLETRCSTSVREAEGNDGHREDERPENSISQIGKVQLRYGPKHEEKGHYESQEHQDLKEANLFQKSAEHTASQSGAEGLRSTRTIP